MVSNEKEGLSQWVDREEEYAAVNPKKRLKVGIIGTGWIADFHAASYQNMPDVELVAGADLIPGKARRFLDKHKLTQAHAYESYEQLLKSEELDAVSVCTYNTTHAECAIAALEHNVHVLLEKPMCVTLEEALAIRRAEQKSGKILSIGFQPRFDANMRMLKKVVQSGALGDVYYIQTGGGRRRGIPTPFGSSFIEQRTGGIGALGDIGCYSLDMVLNAVGYPKPLTVSGYLSNFFGKRPESYPKHPEYAKKFSVDDFAAALIRLEGGIILDFRIAWAMNIDTPCDTILLGTKAGLRIPSTDCWNGTVGGPMTLYSEVAGVQVDTKIPIVEDRGPSLFERKIRTFLNACKNGDRAPVSSEEILYNQAILDGIVRSSEIGREVEIVIPCE